jgi:magnesium transporter
MTAPSPAIAPFLYAERGGFRWFHVEDVKGPALSALAAEFGLHELAVEDCRTPGTRAKLEEYDSHLFLVINTIHFEEKDCSCWFGEINVFVGKDFVITVHDGPSRTAATVLPRFQAEPHLAHSARLLHELMRTIVGRYLPVLDTIEERIDKLEEHAYERPDPRVLAEIFAVKRALIEFRRVATTMREVANLLLTRNEPWLRSHQHYFRDVYDLVVRTLDFADTYRDILTGVLDVHLTASANRTNDIMKVLTVYATLATPFLLVTSFYGMNFDVLPMLHNPAGAAVSMGGTLALSLGLLWFFHRKGWI